MFTIQDNLLQGTSPAGDAVATQQSPNCNPGPITPRFLVFHYTACDFADASSTFLRASGTNRVSAHLLVDRNGAVTQFVPFRQRAWHAGESFWQGFSDINTHSIGIEVVNFGYLLQRADGRYTSADGKHVVSPDEVVEAQHQNPKERHQHWHAYTTAQIETCFALAELLALHYDLRDVVGHDDIAPARKVDPGPAFPTRRMASHAFGRESSAAPMLFVDVPKLNLRSGPGTAHALVRPPLPLNTPVEPQGPPQDGWLKVMASVVQPNEGWVSASFLRSQPLR